MTVRLRFALALADHNAMPFARRRIVELPDWAALACNADYAVKAACELFFDRDCGTWDRFLGATGAAPASAAILVDVIAPRAIAGLYRVELIHTVKAMPRRLAVPPRSLAPARLSRRAGIASPQLAPP